MSLSGGKRRREATKVGASTPEWQGSGATHESCTLVQHHCSGSMEEESDSGGTRGSADQQQQQSQPALISPDVYEVLCRLLILEANVRARFA